jgi:putative glutamine amidotransferase
MAHCDGLVLSGGGDIDPTRYGQECMPGLDSVSAERDDAEFAALREAMRRHIPIFGICRGAQVLNVALGGTLFQDIDRDRPIPSATHQQKGPWSARAHEVTVTPDSRLIDIVGASQLHINSFHHQAIRDVAPGLTVTALAEDGVIEALEMRDYPWGLAVQWHPERNEASADHTHPDRRLFTAFARAVKSRTRATSGAKR